jgi:hypothetical protein
LFDNVKCNDAINLYPALEPTANDVDSGDKTVITPNTTYSTQAIAFSANQAHTLSFVGTHAIANTGATSFFIMEGTPKSNVRNAHNPLTINLSNGEKVPSTQVCNISIRGLPVMLLGHIVPGLSMALLIGICILCKAGCIVIFTDTTCKLVSNTKVILRGFKDPNTDLWTLPINSVAISKTSQDLLAGLVVACTLACLLLRSGLANQKNPDPTECAGFTHLI